MKSLIFYLALEAMVNGYCCFFKWLDVHIICDYSANVLVSRGVFTVVKVLSRMIMDSTPCCVADLSSPFKRFLFFNSPF